MNKASATGKPTHFHRINDRNYLPVPNWQASKQINKYMVVKKKLQPTTGHKKSFMLYNIKHSGHNENEQMATGAHTHRPGYSEG